MLDERALLAIEQHKMILQGDTVTVGVSGGADSVALLCFLHKHKDKLDISLKAAHVNHNLRGDESLRDQRFVEELCAARGIPLAVKSVKIAELAREQGVSLEVCGRDERYSFFGEIAGGGKIATAHNAGDNVETVLLNLARGTSLRGLCGIPPVREGLIRPLIYCSRTAIETYCEAENLDFVTDSSNAGDEYSRNRIRHHAMPALRSVQPELERRVTEMTALLQIDEDYLAGEAEAALAEITCCGGYSRPKYMKLHPAIAARVLISLLKLHRLPYDNARVKMMDSTIKAGSGAVQLPTPPGGCPNKRGAGPRLVVKKELFVIAV